MKQESVGVANREQGDDAPWSFYDLKLGGSSVSFEMLSGRSGPSKLRSRPVSLDLSGMELADEQVWEVLEVNPNVTVRIDGRMYQRR